MKICLLLSASLFWNVATDALCQDVLGTTVILHASSAGRAQLGALADCGAAERSGEGDCQIPWGIYPRGYLWENYCLEEPPSPTRETCRPPAGRTALFELAPPCRVSCAAPPNWRGVARPGRRQRERIICFDLFLELLGWNQCSCCASSCQHRGACCQHQPPQPMAPSVPTEAGEATLAVPPQPAHDVPADGNLDEPPPVPAVTKPSDPKAVTPATPPAADPVDASNRSPLDDPPPAVPHNAIPPSEPDKKEPAQSEPSTAGPSMPRATRRGTVRVLVAERLSDYIKTH